MSDFADMLRRGGFPASLEITPPRRPRADILLRRARTLGDAVEAVNVVQRSDRISSLDASIELQKSGVAPVWHLANRGRRRDEIATDIGMARQMNINLVLCIRGDHPGRDLDDTPKIREVVAMVREAMPHALIGTTANQYGPRERVLRNLTAKLAAGADFVQTQPVWDIDLFASLSQEILALYPQTRIMPMVMPLLSVADADRLQKRVGLALPGSHLEKLALGDATAGWEIFGEILESLSSGELAHAVAVMTLMADPTDAIAQRIVSALRRHI